MENHQNWGRTTFTEIHIFMFFSMVLRTGLDTLPLEII